MDGKRGDKGRRKKRSGGGRNGREQRRGEKRGRMEVNKWRWKTKKKSITSSNSFLVLWRSFLNSPFVGWGIIHTTVQPVFEIPISRPTQSHPHLTLHPHLIPSFTYSPEPSVIWPW